MQHHQRLCPIVLREQPLQRGQRADEHRADRLALQKAALARHRTFERTQDASAARAPEMLGR